MPEAICGRSHLSGVEPFLNGTPPLLRTVRSQVKQKSGDFLWSPMAHAADVQFLQEHRPS